MIKKIEHTKSTVKLETENGATIKAKKLIYATGYEAVNHVKKKIVELNSTFVIISEHHQKQESFWDETIIWNTGKPYLYIRSTPDGRLLVGGRDEKFYDPEKRDKLIDNKTSALEQDFKKLFPASAFKSEFSWAGVFGSTKDGLPYIGEYKLLPNSYFALGFGGNGITFSLIAAEIIRDTIIGKANSDAKIFGFDR